MNILVLGATGKTGREVVDQALAGGHTVTAFVHDPQKLERHEHDAGCNECPYERGMRLSCSAGSARSVSGVVELPERHAIAGHVAARSTPQTAQAIA